MLLSKITTDMLISRTRTVRQEVLDLGHAYQDEYQPEHASALYELASQMRQLIEKFKQEQQTDPPR